MTDPTRPDAPPGIGETIEHLDLDGCRKLFDDLVYCALRGLAEVGIAAADPDLLARFLEREAAKVVRDDNRDAVGYVLRCETCVWCAAWVPRFAHERRHFGARCAGPQLRSLAEDLDPRIEIVVGRLMRRARDLPPAADDDFVWCPIGQLSSSDEQRLHQRRALLDAVDGEWRSGATIARISGVDSRRVYRALHALAADGALEADQLASGRWRFRARCE